MIYYLSKYLVEAQNHPGFSFDLTSIKLKDIVNKLGAANVGDDIKAKDGYYSTRISEEYLTDSKNRRVSPSSGDVIIYGEIKYGIIAVLDSIKSTQGNSYEMFIARLPEVVFGKPRTFHHGAP